MSLRDGLKKTGRTGVYYKEHDTRKHGLKKDRLFVLRFTLGGKTYVETFGWLSEGKSEIDAEKKLAEFRANFKAGVGPICIADEKAELELLLAVEAKRKAEEEAQRLLEERKNITFGEFWSTHYFPHCQASKKTGSWKTERSIFDLWLKPAIGKLRFSEIAPLHLRGVRKKMLDGGRALASVRMAYCVVQQVWGMAKADGYTVAECPTRDKTAAMPTKKTMNNERERFLTAEEAEVLLQALRKKSEDVADAALLSLHTGMRSGEVFGLEWSNIDLHNAKLRLLDTKTRSPRTVPLTATAIAMLKARKKVSTSGYVFPSRTGDPIKNVSTTFDRVVDALGFNEGVEDRRKRLVFHSLRHSAASFLVQSGVPLYTVSQILGHSSMDMTKRYSHLELSDLKDAVGNIDRALASRSKGTASKARND